MKKLMVSAGEVSGDVQAYYLILELKKIIPDLSICGMGGDMMRSAGVDVRLDIRRRGTIGIIETIKHLPYTITALIKMKKMLKEEKPDALLLIDSQGFNVPLAQYAKKIGIKTIYYIAPQEWLWGTRKGIKKVVSAVDLIVAIFEKEYNSYQENGGNVVYYGHPVIDIAKAVKTKESMRSELGVSGKSPVIGLLPGSRAQEIQMFLPILIQSSQMILIKFPNSQFLLPVSSQIFRHEIESRIPEKFPIRILNENRNDVMNSCDLLIAASGTVLLEAVKLDIPAIMIYKLSKVTEFIAKKILRIKLPFLGMPNLLAGKAVIPELVQGDCNPKKIYETAVDLIENREKLDEIKKSISDIKKNLGSPGMINKIAKKIAEFTSK